MTAEEFDDLTKQQFINDDREAWNSICTILLGIISVGLGTGLPRSNHRALIAHFADRMQAR